MDPFSAFILGVVQALTEFLPVSSSGHLVLGQALLGVKSAGAAFEVAVHFGTLLSVLLVFRRDVAALLASVLRGGHRGRWAAGEAELRMVVAIVVGCVPAGVVGLAFRHELEAAFDSPRLVCVALLATGVVLLATRHARAREGDVTVAGAFTIGVAQAIAIIPGVSRSGSTIAMALFLGVERAQAARYSFLLSLPIILGATGLQASGLMSSPPSADMATALAIGVVVAFLAGVGALLLLLDFVRRGWFAHFGWYCLTVGAGGLFLV